MWPVMFNAVGGSSIYYGAEWPRLLPSDFRVKTLDGVGDDWPITYNDLKPYHDEVDEFIGVSGVGGDTAYPEGLDYPLPPHPLGKPGMKAAAAANELGWHWWPGTNAIPSQKNKTLEQCGRWGVCEWGCPQGAKASFDLIYMPQAQQAGAEVHHRRPGPQGRHRRRRARHRRGMDRPRRQRPLPTSPRSGAVRQRHRHTSATAALGHRPTPRRSGELLRTGRPQPDAASQLQRASATTRRTWKVGAARPVS